MKVILTGTDDVEDIHVLEQAIKCSGWTGDITEVICGMSPGADMLGWTWAGDRGIRLREFKDEKKLKAADKKTKNLQMAFRADKLIAVQNKRDRNLDHLVKTMKKLDKPYFVYHTHEQTWIGSIKHERK